jgi:hypothetical protein
MKNLVLTLLVCCLTASSIHAQEVYNSSGKPGYHKKTKKQKGYDPSRLVLGGGLSGEFSDGYTEAGISPMVGYRFTNRLTAGVGLGYLYVSEADNSLSATQTYYDKENIIYPNVWTRFMVYRGFYISGQFEYDFISQSGPDGYYFDQYGQLHITQANQNFQMPCLLLGPGYKLPITGRVSVFAELLIDVLNEPNSPYNGQPQIRIGVCAGL